MSTMPTRADGYHREDRDGQCLLLLTVAGEERIIARSALPTDRSWAPTNQAVVAAEAMQREVAPRPDPAPLVEPTRIGNVPVDSPAGVASLRRVATPRLALVLLLGAADAALALPRVA